MKKTMKSLLSLTLVLVMVLGMMPMAMAAECNHDTSYHKVDASKSTAATCTDYAKTAYYCDYNVGDDCDATWVVTGDELDPDGHKWGSAEKKAANCSEPEEMCYFCEYCEKMKTEAVDGGAAATGKHNYVNGKCDIKLHDGSYCGASASTVVTADDVTVNVGGTGKIGLNVTEGYTKIAVKSVSVANSSIATVAKSDLKVTGKKAGTTTATIVVTVDGKDYTATAKITVYNGVITCAEDMKEYSGSSATLTFKLESVGTVDKIKWTYTVTGAGEGAETSEETTGKSASLKIDRDGYGLVTVKVTAEWGNDEKNVSTFHISFYETENADVYVKDGVKDFDFGDKDVFSKIVKGAVSVTNVKNYKMMSFLTGSDSEVLVLSESSSTNSKVGKITSSNPSYNPKSSNRYDMVDAYDINFKVLGEGKYKLDYAVKNVVSAGKGLTVKTGTITIITGEAEADIIYKVAPGGTVTLKESDFTSFWKKYGTGTMNYVEFDVSYTKPYAPEIGALYTDDTQKTLVQKTMDFATKPAANSNDYDLGEVIYAANPKATEAYVDSLNFTIYNADGEYVSGIIEFQVDMVNPFTDVKESDYFYDAVMWAVAEDITQGTSATTFSPDAACTRGQVVTFLWRAAGEPAPKSTVSKFTDIKKGDYYYNAVLWAVEKGITTGLTATTFGPNAACTRAQVVTFLYRAAGAPSVTGFNSFRDVASNAYYYDAVLWAVKKNITNGMDANNFGSNNTCTRGQIVTFLYRYVVD